MKTMIKLSFVMAAYAVVACVGLALVYNLTAPVIAESANQAVKKSLKVVFPAASDFEEVTDKVKSDSASIVFERAYLAKSGDSVVGMIVQATGPTYKSSTVLVGVDMQRKLLPPVFMANTDTPGLGSKTAESPFSDQFPGKSVDDKFKVGTDITAISGATISSRGVSSIMKLAGWKAAEYLAANCGGAAGTGEAPLVVDLAPMPAMDALADIFPGAEFERLVDNTVSNIVEKSVVFSGAWLVKKDSKVVALAIQAKGQTYYASTLLVAVNLDRTLAGVRVNETKDSRVYGYNMVSPDFYGQFAGKAVDDPYQVSLTESGGAPAGSPDDVDAISGATVSTMGVANIVKVAAYSGSAYLAKEYGGKKGPALPKSGMVLNVLPEQE
jgi:electron transport complex protein RnfG